MAVVCEDWLADLEVCLEEKLLSWKPGECILHQGYLSPDIPPYPFVKLGLFQNVHPQKIENDVPCFRSAE